MKNERIPVFTLCNAYMHIPPNTSKRKRLKGSIDLPKGVLTYVHIRLLSGNGDKTEFSIKGKGKTVYKTSKTKRLSPKTMTEVYPIDLDLEDDLTTFELEGHNEDDTQISRVMVDFTLVSSHINLPEPELLEGKENVS